MAFSGFGSLLSSGVESYLQAKQLKMQEEEAQRIRKQQDLSNFLAILGMGDKLPPETLAPLASQMGQGMGLNFTPEMLKPPATPYTMEDLIKMGNTTGASELNKLLPGMRQEGRLPRELPEDFQFGPFWQEQERTQISKDKEQDRLARRQNLFYNTVSRFVSQAGPLGADNLNALISWITADFAAAGEAPPSPEEMKTWTSTYQAMRGESPSQPPELTPGPRQQQIEAGTEKTQVQTEMIPREQERKEFQTEQSVRQGDVRLDQGQQRIQQGDVRLGQGQQRIDETVRHNKAGENISRQRVDLAAKAQASTQSAKDYNTRQGRLKIESKAIGDTFTSWEREAVDLSKLPEGPAKEKLKGELIDRVQRDGPRLEKRLAEVNSAIGVPQAASPKAPSSTKVTAKTTAPPKAAPKSSVRTTSKSTVKPTSSKGSGSSSKTTSGSTSTKGTKGVAQLSSRAKAEILVWKRRNPKASHGQAWEYFHKKHPGWNKGSFYSVWNASR